MTITPPTLKNTSGHGFSLVGEIVEVRQLEKMSLIKVLVKGSTVELFTLTYFDKLKTVPLGEFELDISAPRVRGDFVNIVLNSWKEV